MKFDHFPFDSCVAENVLGRTKKYIEVCGRPGPAEFLSSPYSSHLNRYNLTFKVESIPELDEIKILYRKLMVSEVESNQQTSHKYDSQTHVHNARTKANTINL